MQEDCGTLLHSLLFPTSWKMLLSKWEIEATNSTEETGRRTRNSKVLQNEGKKALCSGVGNFS